MTKRDESEPVARLTPSELVREKSKSNIKEEPVKKEGRKNIIKLL